MTGLVDKLIVGQLRGKVLTRRRAGKFYRVLPPSMSEFSLRGWPEVRLRGYTQCRVVSLYELWHSRGQALSAHMMIYIPLHLIDDARSIVGCASHGIMRWLSLSFCLIKTSELRLSQLSVLFELWFRGSHARNNSSSSIFVDELATCVNEFWRMLSLERLWRFFPLHDVWNLN